MRSSYDELKERLELKEMINNMKCLPAEIDIDDYFDDTFINDNNLPDVVIDIVEEYNDKITYLMLNKNTDGDRTRITHVDCLLYTSRCV